MSSDEVWRIHRAPSFHFLNHFFLFLHIYCHSLDGLWFRYCEMLDWLQKGVGLTAYFPLIFSLVVVCLVFFRCCCLLLLSSFHFFFCSIVFFYYHRFRSSVGLLAVLFFCFSSCFLLLASIVYIYIYIYITDACSQRNKKTRYLDRCGHWMYGRCGKKQHMITQSRRELSLSKKLSAGKGGINLHNPYGGGRKKEKKERGAETDGSALSMEGNARGVEGSQSGHIKNGISLYDGSYGAFLGSQQNSRSGCFFFDPTLFVSLFVSHAHI
eukprot:gene1496-883_t